LEILPAHGKKHGCARWRNPSDVVHHMSPNAFICFKILFWTRNTRRKVNLLPTCLKWSVCLQLLLVGWIWRSGGFYMWLRSSRYSFSILFLPFLTWNCLMWPLCLVLWLLSWWIMTMATVNQTLILPLFISSCLMWPLCLHSLLMCSIWFPFYCLPWDAWWWTRCTNYRKI
jgi:hypothetical protein